MTALKDDKKKTQTSIQTKDLLLDLALLVYREVRLAMQARGLSHKAESDRRKLSKALDKAAMQILVHSPVEIIPEMAKDRANSIVDDLWPGVELS